MTSRMLARAIAAQVRSELTLTLRRGETVLVTLVVPVALLAFFASARVLPSGKSSINFLLPGTMALAVISTGLVSLGIATAYERYYGVLKRYGSTPFPRSALIASKLIAVSTLELVQITLLIVVAVFVFGWMPAGSVWLAFAVLSLGTLAFAGMGMAMAGRLRAEATLAGANALFILFLLLGGLFAPLSHLPTWIVPVARVLPAEVLAEVLRSVLKSGAHIPLRAAILLVGWAIAMPAVAARTFRWE